MANKMARGAQLLIFGLVRGRDQDLQVSIPVYTNDIARHNECNL